MLGTVATGDAVILGIVGTGTVVADGDGFDEKSNAVGVGTKLILLYAAGQNSSNASVASV